MLAAPKLARQPDSAALSVDAKLCIGHLTPLVQQRVQHSWWLRAASWGALLALCAVLVIAAMAYLRGRL
jgi:hypothetical protein